MPRTSSSARAQSRRSPACVREPSAAVKLEPGHFEDLQGVVRDLNEDGFRVIAVAYKEVPAHSEPMASRTSQTCQLNSNGPFHVPTLAGELRLQFYLFTEVKRVLRLLRAGTDTESGHKIPHVGGRPAYAKSKTPYTTDREAPMVGKLGKH